MTALATHSSTGRPYRPALCAVTGAGACSALTSRRRSCASSGPLWAVDAALLARTSERLLVRTTLAAGAANVAWELGTIGLVVAGAFSGLGAVVALAVRGRRRAGAAAAARRTPVVTSGDRRRTSGGSCPHALREPGVDHGLSGAACEGAA